uniref:Uncharacterized protein n=1 Tax=Strigamia maritima TaxID=126957 RepID=T1IP20_STRMM
MSMSDKIKSDVITDIDLTRQSTLAALFTPILNEVKLAAHGLDFVRLRLDSETVDDLFRSGFR